MKAFYQKKKCEVLGEEGGTKPCSLGERKCGGNRSGA